MRHPATLPLKTSQELLESRAVLGWADLGGFFMAVAIDLKEVLGRKGCVVYLPAELKRNNGILTAVDNQNGCVDFP